MRPHNEEEWDRLDQEAIDNAISEWSKRFWTFTLNITAFVHIVINMFWNFVNFAEFRVKHINFSCTSNGLAGFFCEFSNFTR